MTLDPFNIPLVPNEWFSTEAVYVGRGRAEIENPKGAAEGPITARFDEYGESNVEMTVEEFLPEQQLQLGPMEFFSGEKPIKQGDAVSLPIGSEFKQNPCTKLIVTTPEGMFSATEGIHYWQNINITENTVTRLTFDLIRSQFDAAGKGPARYWVLPLANFISDFVYNHHADLNQHPLRIYPTPDVPAGLTDKEGFAARHNANLKNRLIVFEFNGELAFIERLADYDTRKDNLLEGRERYTITAIMVGEIGANSIEFADLDDWLPSEFLRLLGLVTGTRVGAPWIEFRDAQGELVRRIYTSWEGASFSKGHRSLREGIHSGTGYLLTRYLSSPDRGKPYLRVALKHLIQAGIHTGSIEDRFVYLCRAIEGLCEHYGLKQQNLLQGLDATYQSIVRQALRNAADKVKASAQSSAAAGQHDQSRLLNKIVDRTVNAANKDRDFGLAVADLLKLFKLPDADIVDAYYQTNPRPDGRRTWASVLSYYRGAPTHRGYFNFSGKEHDLYDILTIKDHLHDILLRIIFKIIDYDGTYQPPVIKGTIDSEADWVKPDTPISRLGYQ